MSAVQYSEHVPVESRAPADAATRGPIRVALVDDVELVCAGLEAMLQPLAARVQVTGLDASNGSNGSVDIVLFDTLGHPWDAANRVRDLAADPRVGAVAVYTWRLAPGQLDAALDAGARGALAKSLTATELADELLAVHAGEVVVSAALRTEHDDAGAGHVFGLTARETEVASLLARGLSNREIAASLFISEHTVKTHLKAIFRKTGVGTRARAVARIESDLGAIRMPGSEERNA